MVLVLGIVLVSSILMRAVYISVSTSGLQAEARLMLTYLHTLQRAQSAESGKFIKFEEYYGAPILGKDNCVQPEGAAQLGFTISWCHSDKPSPVNYAYRLLSDSEDFRIQGKSGSDKNSASFVCFGYHENDIWEVRKSRQVERVSSCTSRF